MDVSVQYAEPVKEGLIIPNDWGQLWSNCKQGSSTVDSLVAELGSALEDALVLLSTPASPLEGCEVCCLEKDSEFGDLIITRDESLIVKSQTELGDNVTLPCSRNMLFSDIHLSGKEEISNASLDRQSSLQSGNPTSTSIMPIPTSLKLVSAMKGSREKQGRVVKLRVSWAADVYDPPATSQSHTVKSHNNHSSMMNKKSYRRKHKHKAKSPRSSSIDKKQHRKNR